MWGEMASELRISERLGSGKREARRLRHNGFVPGIIYGTEKEPLKVAVGEKELLSECYSSAFMGHVINTKIGSCNEKILPRSVDFDPVTDRPVHVDFLRVSKDSKVKIHIPIEVINADKCAGLKKGGLVNFVVHQLECLCSPDAIPDKLVLDVARKEIGESFALDSLKLPAGVSAAHPERDAVIATLVGAKVSDDADKTASTEGQSAG
ncbi:50S ribosomal protein L25 [Alphaproteobacteria bacterium]|nr:50S ribosomal protein L25 [Alphaproteobacteria bacterium]